MTQLFLYSVYLFDGEAINFLPARSYHEVVVDDHGRTLKIVDHMLSEQHFAGTTLNEVGIARAVAGKDKSLAFLVEECHRTGPSKRIERSAVHHLAGLLAERSEIGIAASLALTNIGKNQVGAISFAKQRSAVEPTVKVFAAEVEFAALNLLFPHGLSGEAVEFDKMADALCALLVNLASAVDKGNAVLNLANDAAIDVVVVVVVPHRSHGAEVDADNIAMIIAEESVVAVHAEAVLHSGGYAATAIAHGSVERDSRVLYLIFIYGAVLSRPEEEVAHSHR